MQLTINTNELDTDTLGKLLVIFLASGVDLSTGTYVVGAGWMLDNTVAHRYEKILLGDQVNDPNHPTCVVLWHMETDLRVAYCFDGDLSVVFHKDGPDGFAIENRGSSLSRWEEVQL